MTTLYALTLYATTQKLILLTGTPGTAIAGQIKSHISTRSKSKAICHKLNIKLSPKSLGKLKNQLGFQIMYKLHLNHNKHIASKHSPLEIRISKL